MNEIVCVHCHREIADDEIGHYDVVCNECVMQLVRREPLNNFEKITESPEVLANYLAENEVICDMCALRRDDTGTCGGPHECPKGIGEWLKRTSESGDDHADD